MNWFSVRFYGMSDIIKLEDDFNIGKIRKNLPKTFVFSALHTNIVFSAQFAPIVVLVIPREGVKKNLSLSTYSSRRKVDPIPIREQVPLKAGLFF